MRYALRFTLLLGAAAFVWSCAASSGSGSNRERGSRNLISQEELAALPPSLSAYDAVRRLRSTWLRTRGAASLRGNLRVQVYMDNVRLGGVEFLQNRSLDGVKAIRYYNGRDATTKWGTGVVGGVIELITNR